MIGVSLLNKAFGVDIIGSFIEDVHGVGKCDGLVRRSGTDVTVL
jgi:hypothetical protein